MFRGQVSRINQMQKYVLSLPILFCAAAAMNAHGVEVAGIFSDHMILQRDRAVPVWGKGRPGETVTVKFKGQEVVATVDQTGKWMVRLQPLKTSFIPVTMTINDLVLKDVLVGEVWLAVGQSNMARGKKTDLSGDENLVIRCSQHRSRIETPEVREPGWGVGRKFSTVSFFFAREIARRTKAPVGMITRAVSGSPIQSWMPKELAEDYREKAGIPKDWNDDLPFHSSGDLFSPLLEPVIPYAIRGAIWYQGERNAKRRTPWHYREMQPLMIGSWRKRWGFAFPFVTVQPPVWDKNHAFDVLRDSMRRVAVNDPKAGLAVTYDVERKTHPKDLRPAGQRLAQWALSEVYGMQDVAPCPLLTRHEVKDGQVILRFQHVGAGLKTAEKQDKLGFFEVCGSDGEYYPAGATIQNGDTVILSAKQVPEPRHARYLFGKKDTAMSLYNSQGLPASPFITDPDFGKNASFRGRKDSK